MHGTSGPDVATQINAMYNNVITGYDSYIFQNIAN